MYASVSALLPEVGAAGRKDDAMGIDFLGAHHQYHIAELTVLPQQVNHLQGLPRVFVRDVRHARRLGDAFGKLVRVPQSAAAGDVHSSGVLTCAGGPRDTLSQASEYISNALVPLVRAT